MIKPILLYGSEILALKILSVIEQIHLKFCERILGVRNTSSKYMVYGELGKFLLQIRV